MGGFCVAFLVCFCGLYGVGGGEFCVVGVFGVGRLGLLSVWGLCVVGFVLFPWVWF